MLTQPDHTHDKLGNTAENKTLLRLWLRMLTCGNLITQGIRTLLRIQYDTTLPRFDLMAALERAPENGLTMGELSRWLMVTNANITNIANRLVQDGLVRRTPKPEDQRISYLSLTDKGRMEFGAMAKTHERYISEIFGVLSPEEVDTLMQLLGKVKEAALSIDQRELKS